MGSQRECASTSGPCLVVLVSSTQFHQKLIIIGDQSTRKSFLHEKLTGLSFSIASDLCTRFATQIVLRRAQDEDVGVKVTIISNPSAQSIKIKTRLLRSKQEVLTKNFDSKEFQNIFDEVCFD